MELRLTHHSYCQLRLADIRRYKQNTDPSDKPSGFWVSVNGDWKRWTKAEKFLLGNHEHLVKLKRTKRILVLTTVDELKRFTKKFSKIPSYLVSNRYRSTWNIDWAAVAKLHAGIIITPYQWTCRHSMDTSWYYTWDCASGCIWDPTVIKSMRRLPNRKRSKP